MLWYLLITKSMVHLSCFLNACNFWFPFYIVNLWIFDHLISNFLLSIVGQSYYLIAWPSWFPLCFQSVWLISFDPQYHFNIYLISKNLSASLVIIFIFSVLYFTGSKHNFINCHYTCIICMASFWSLGLVHFISFILSLLLLYSFHCFGVTCVFLCFNQLDCNSFLVHFKASIRDLVLPSTVAAFSLSAISALLKSVISSTFVHCAAIYSGICSMSGSEPQCRVCRRDCFTPGFSC